MEKEVYKKMHMMGIKEAMLTILIVFAVSVLFFSDFLLYDKLPITSCDPAIKFWGFHRNANLINSGFLPLWDNTSGVGRSVFAHDILGSAFSAPALFISLFENHILGYITFLWLQLVLFGLALIYYLKKWHGLDPVFSFISFGVFIFCPALLNEFFYNSFVGYLLLPIMLDQVERFTLRQSLISAVWVGCFLAVSHWISNISVPQFSAVFIAVYLTYRIWDSKRITNTIFSVVSFMLIAGSVWIGLMAFYIAPMFYEVVNGARSHLSSLTGGSSLKAIALSFVLPFTSGLFMDEMMIPTGFLTRLESLSDYVHILLLPSIIMFLGNRSAFSRGERFFFYYVIGFLFFSWLNNYIPILGYLQRIIKGTGWWRSYPLYVLAGSFCIGITISKLKSSKLVWNKGILNKSLIIFLKVLSLVFGMAFIAFVLILIVGFHSPGSPFEFLSRYTMRPVYHLELYFKNYYLTWPRAFYIAVAMGALALSAWGFIKQSKRTGKTRYFGPTGLLVIIVAGQYSLTQIYYPFNSGIKKTQELKETQILSRLDSSDRIGIIFNTQHEIEKKVREDIGYTDKDASLELSIALQAYPEITRFQSNITMDGSYFSSLGPAVYTRGSHFTSQRLADYHSRILEASPDLKAYFEKIKSYLCLSPVSIDSRLLDIAGLNYVISSLPLSHEKLEQVARGDIFFIYKNTSAVPKFYFSNKAVTTDDKKTIFSALESVDFKPGFNVVIEKKLNITKKDGPIGKIGLEEYSSGRIKLAVDSVQSGLVVINEGYHPGWTAHIDGKESEILRANYLFMALPLGPGKHYVELSFEPPAFRFGLIISCLTLGALLLVIIAKWFKYRKEGPREQL
ncbi:MAG: YfhO family protein [Thermodesulfobacteriota bacterium]